MKKNLVFITLIFFLCSCKKTNDVNKEIIDSTIIEINEFEKETIDFDLNYIIPYSVSVASNIIYTTTNPLTGLPIDLELLNKRPYAVVFNNLRAALPQSGISESEIYYEVLAEADITRIIGVSQNFKSEKIGPIRSTRDYFVDFALDNDAIFVHHGGSPGGYEFIYNNKINDLDGMKLEGISFYRDYDRARERGLEHSSYTGSEKIKQSAIDYSFRLDLNDSFRSSFKFFQTDTILKDSPSAIKLTVPFSNYQQSVFVYNPEEKIYYRFQGENPHIDEINNSQLTVKNIVVIFVKMQVIDKEGRRKVSLIDKGDGYFFTNGNYIPIKWIKEGHFLPTKFFDENNQPLKFNKGKTWICFYQIDGELKIIE